MKRLKQSLITVLVPLYILCFLWPSLSMASDKTYTRYTALLSNMKNQESVANFIDEKNYLSDRLLKKWLAYLAKRKRWQDYLTYYQPTKNITRQCHYLHALHQANQSQTALKHVKKIWLTGHKQPKACRYIFKKWQLSQYFNDDLLWQRITLVMQAKQDTFVKQLMSNLPKRDQALISQWQQLIKHPTRLNAHIFTKHPYTTHIIVSVLKHLIYKDMKSAIMYWQKNETKYPFSYAQKQAIYQKLALYLAIRNKTNAEDYFAKLDPETTPDLYHEWRLRAALKEHRWHDINQIIKFLPTHLHNKPCWQYWYARSFEKLGEHEKANALYALLSDKRHYYGFLASHRGGFDMTMQQQKYLNQPELLSPHKNQINYINTLYKRQRIDKASLLSYELSNDLSKAAQYQLAKHYSTWQWHDKALMLANLSQYKNDLFLRFPLAHAKLIEKYSIKYDVPEAFVYAIIRQESTFRKKVKSSAGALGLMQVIPSTARKVSKQYHIPLRSMKHMYQAKTNINIGVAYLNHLSKRFDNHPILMAAAYNAGPSQVSRWLKKSNKEETDLWIETLPWHETRNYLKNVMSFYVVYQHRLNDTPSLEPFMK